MFKLPFFVNNSKICINERESANLAVENGKVKVNLAASCKTVVMNDWY